MKFEVTISPITVGVAPIAEPDIGLVIGPVSTRPFTPREEEPMPLVQLTDRQRVRIAIDPLDEMKNPAPIDGIPTWESSDPSILTVEATDDGRGVMAVTGGPLGTATVTVTADADMGDGIEPLTGTVDFEVVGSEARSLNVSVGTPEPRE
jgi:hypothetical protein